MSLTGECFCGRVKYEIRGNVFGARSCHCSRCRKAFSAQASAYALVDDGALSWTEGEAFLTSFVGDGGTGKMFCSQCGSMLCGIVGGRIHGIALGCLNESPPGLVLKTHIFAASKASWELLPAGVTAYEEGPTERIE